MDWPMVRLDKLYKIGSSKRVLKSQWESKGVPFYRGREITLLAKSGYVDNDLFISEELYLEYAAKYGAPEANDIVITAIGTIGNSYVVRAEDRFYFKDASVLWLKKTSNIDSSFINLWLKSPLMRAQLDNGNGATVDTLTIKKLQSLQVKLPPIPEQQRIVAILDQAFAEIEKARANAEQNLKNARELFDSYLQQVFSQRGEGWVERRLEDFLDIGSSKRIYETDWTTSGVPFYGGKEIVKLAKGEPAASNAYISEEKYMDYASRYDMPKEDDILMTARGTIGVGYIVKAGEKFYYKDGNIISLRGKVPTNPHFILYAFKSKKITCQIEGLTGTTVNHLPLNKAKNLVLNIPEYDAQTVIVSRLRAFEIEIQSLVQAYDGKLSALDELKKSLLQKAFSGELTKSKGMAA